MTATTQNTAVRKGRPPLPEQDRKSKNRLSVNISDAELMALGVEPREASALVGRLIADEIRIKAEQGA